MMAATHDIAKTDTADERAIRAWTKRIERLHAARHIALVPGLALGISAIVLSIIGLVLLIVRGQLTVLQALPSVLVLSCALGLAGWFKAPRIEADLARAAHEGVEPWRCPGLLKATIGLPMYRHRLWFEMGLAGCLASLTKERWEQHEDAMHGPVELMLDSYHDARLLRPVEPREPVGTRLLVRPSDDPMADGRIGRTVDRDAAADGDAVFYGEASR